MSEHKPRLKSAYDFCSLVYCFIVYCVFVSSPALHNIYHTPMARYSLFVLKVLLNTNSVWCIVSLFIVCLCHPLALHNIFHIPMAGYSLFVLKVPLKHQSTDQPGGACSQ